MADDPRLIALKCKLAGIRALTEQYEDMGRYEDANDLFHREAWIIEQIIKLQPDWAGE